MSDSLVLGLGNELFTDEGVGVAAARRIAELKLPGVEVIDGGTLGLYLLPSIESRPAVLVLDAITGEDALPGDVIVFSGHELRRESRLLYSAHQLGLNEVLAAADLMGASPGRVMAVGMVPASLNTGYGLSETALRSLPTMVEVALGVLDAWKPIREGAHA